MTNFEYDTVIYHDPCVDGFTSAFLATRYKEATLVPLKINNYPMKMDDNIIDKNVLIVDIVPINYEEIKIRAKGVYILDHHITNQDKLKGINYAHFDMNLSGVGLMWNFLYPNKSMPEYLKYIQERDLWQFSCDESRNFTDGLYQILSVENVQRGFQLLDELHNDQNRTVLEKYISFGKLIGEAKRNKIENIFKYSKLFRVKVNNEEFNIRLFNVDYELSSDLGNYAMINDNNCDFAVMWNYSHGTNEYKYSLRSIYQKTDASKIASLFGGGGHRNACGFCSKKHPNEIFVQETPHWFTNTIKRMSGVVKDKVCGVYSYLFE
jgi:oligoribonuclease NrnB/cAMP/cGMP phosphodiesterase (DHH superfamily)